MKSMIARYNSRQELAFLAGFLPAVFLFGPAQSAEPGQLFTFFQAEQFEYRANDGHDSLNWDAQGWIGNDDHKAWLKTEGEKPTDGRLEKGEIQLLYSRRISDFFDAQAGVRYDIEPGPERGFGVFALQGLAPYWFEIDASAFVSNEGEVSARFEAEYDLLITQKLILQPTTEVNFAVQSVRERGIGSGINDVELGLRLRYEIERKFAPYIGISWERKIGETADIAQDEGEDIDTLSFVTGIRFSF
ncbi:copper resistance protein B [Zavarzinia compransoris]|uniref:copper resistance protein B n=1 Tax=Zavarzinia marina TaxID=2911065 RepID=UPI001F429C66|nr:copper resistance protein B [Zavarzinia marina]MCF4167546.1 copper resistance protein B [Zavarzinia marina]